MNQNALILSPQTHISRPLSAPEYYHACIGTSAYTLESAREIVFVIEGLGVLPEARWQQALGCVTTLHPGTRLRITGRRGKTRWCCDGAPTRLRFVDHVLWDSRSEIGAEFIQALPLSLEAGPSSELIITQSQNRCVVIVRALHAVMDGRGALFFLQELFRALRGESLLGTNAFFSDVDLIRSVGTTKSTSKHRKTVALTGSAQGGERGDTWRRITLFGQHKNVLARVAKAMAIFTHQHSDLPALIAVPIDLRRHAPALHSTLNFSSMLLIGLCKHETAEDFQQKLNDMLLQKMETFYMQVFNWIKLLPLHWLDRLVSRTLKNEKNKTPLETAVLSNLGLCAADAFSCDGFQAETLYGIPLKGSTFCFLFGTKDRLEITLGMPKNVASNGRLDAFLDFLQDELTK